MFGEGAKISGVRLYKILALISLISRISVFCIKKFKKIREIAEFIPNQLRFHEIFETGKSV